MLYANDETYRFGALKNNAHMTFFFPKRYAPPELHLQARKTIVAALENKNPCFPLKGLAANNIQKYPLWLEGKLVEVLDTGAVLGK